MFLLFKNKKQKIHTTNSNLYYGLCYGSMSADDKLFSKHTRLPHRVMRITISHTYLFRKIEDERTDGKNINVETSFGRCSRQPLADQEPLIHIAHFNRHKSVFSFFFFFCTFTCCIYKYNSNSGNNNEWGKLRCI